jgi:hypothetical protein
MTASTPPGASWAASGNPTSSARNATPQAIATGFEPRAGSARATAPDRPRKKTAPASAPAAIATTCAYGLAGRNTMNAATAAAAVRRGQSGQSVRNIPTTAANTTATAATKRPCTQRSRLGSVIRATPIANPTMRSADGRVNPVHAASAPSAPARIRPIMMPTWLLAGPGSN